MPKRQNESKGLKMSPNEATGESRLLRAMDTNICDFSDIHFSDANVTTMVTMANNFSQTKWHTFIFDRVYDKNDPIGPSVYLKFLEGVVRTDYAEKVSFKENYFNEEILKGIFAAIVANKNSKLRLVDLSCLTYSFDMSVMQIIANFISDPAFKLKLILSGINIENKVYSPFVIEKNEVIQIEAEPSLKEKLESFLPQKKSPKKPKQVKLASLQDYEALFNYAKVSVKFFAEGNLLKVELESEKITDVIKKYFFGFYPYPIAGHGNFFIFGNYNAVPAKILSAKWHEFWNYMQRVPKPTSSSENKQGTKEIGATSANPSSQEEPEQSKKEVEKPAPDAVLKEPVLTSENETPITTKQKKQKQDVAHFASKTQIKTAEQNLNRIMSKIKKTDFSDYRPLQNELDELVRKIEGFLRALRADSEERISVAKLEKMTRVEEDFSNIIQSKVNIDEQKRRVNKEQSQPVVMEKERVLIPTDEKSSLVQVAAEDKSKNTNDKKPLILPKSNNVRSSIPSKGAKWQIKSQQEKKSSDSDKLVSVQQEFNNGSLGFWSELNKQESQNNYKGKVLGTDSTPSSPDLQEDVANTFGLDQ